MRKRLACALLALTLPLSACAAAPAELRSVTLPPASPLPMIEEKEEPRGAELLPVYLDGLLTTRAYRKEDTVFIELRPLCAKAGIDMDWSGDEKSFTLTLDSLLVEGKAGQQYFTASGRYLYAPKDWLIRGGELCLPEWVVCKLLNLGAGYRDGDLYLDGEKLCLLEGGEDYYELNFPYGDIHWLSHIITSEAGIEPMEGKIGVGNVVMNRVKSAEFPDTVFGVVYDYEHTIQFEPVSRGTIHDDPKPEDIIAAYLVLEGANTAGNCIYFVNPQFGSFWFDNNLDFVIKLGRHNFYVKKGQNYAGTNIGAYTAAGA